MLLIQTSIRHPRLSYTLDYIFGERLGLEYKLVDQSDGGDILVYNPGGDIIPAAPIWVNAIAPIPVQLGKWDGAAVLFPSAGAIPFDLFAAVFWLLSRYEEYGVESKDTHDRFTSKMSALNADLIAKPLIDLWLKQFATWLMQKYGLASIQEHFEWEPTIDVDSAYAFRGKGVYRTLGGFAKDLKNRELINAGERFKSLVGKKEDPYNTYESLHRLHDHAGVKARFFFLLGDFDTYDKGLPHGSDLLKKLILDTQKKAHVALHPSVASHVYPKKISQERKRLSDLLKEEVDHSRFHYLKFQLPTTYRDLLAAGISNDHTMGYHDHIGFRAGTSRSFLWFDLIKNEVSPLRVHPFSVMEATLKNYMKLSPDEAVNTVKSLAEDLKAAGGKLCTLWHNESLSDFGEWEGWGDVYQRSFERD